MSYISDLSLDEDKDNSAYENSLFVLPTKTVLNSKLHLNTHENTNYKNTYDDTQFKNSRKMGSNIEIPSYKGFSIASGDYKSINQVPLKQPKLIIDGVKMDDKNVKRKQNAIKTDKGKLQSDEFLKKLRAEKLKWPTKEEVNYKSNPDDVVKNPIKNTETFWTGSGLKKPIKINSDKQPKEDSNHGHNKHYSQEVIKNYMDKKQHEQKTALKEKGKLEKEKEIRIKKNLRKLSDNQRSQTFISSKPNNNVQCQSKEKRCPKLELVRQIIEEFEETSTSERSCGSDTIEDSEVSRHSLKRHILEWQPLDENVLESYANKDRSGIKRAIDNNKHVIKILDKISLMKDKMESSRQEIIDFSRSNKFGEPVRKRELKLSSVELSDSEMTYDDDTNSTINLSVITKNTKENAMKDRNLSTVTKRVHGKLFNDNIILRESKKMDVDEEAYGDCVSRLLEENRERYERGLDFQTATVVPLTNNIRKPMAPVAPYRGESLKNVPSAGQKDDPLRFIKIYKKSSGLIKSATPTVSKSVEQLLDSSEKRYLPLVVDSDRDLSESSHVINVSHNMEVKSPEPKVVDIEHHDDSDTSQTKNSTLEDLSSSGRYQERMPSVSYVPRTNKYMDEARLSPASLERQFRAELDYYESVDVCMEQLLQSDRLQGVAIAQQETVSLAQILKARQWQEGRQETNNEQIQQFTNILENFSKNLPRRSHKKHASYSSTNTIENSSIIDNSSEYSSKLKAKTSTESDASEIEEEIADNQTSTMMTRKIPAKVHVQKPVPKSRVAIKQLKIDLGKSISTENSEIMENIENYTESSEFDREKTDSEDKSIKEISTQKSFDSSSTITDPKLSSVKEISTEKGSFSNVPHSNRTIEDQSQLSDKSIRELSTGSSIASESTVKSVSSDAKVPSESLPKSSGRSIKDRSDSVKEVSTARSENKLSEYSNSFSTASISPKIPESERSDNNYSVNTFENSATKSFKANESIESEHSDVIARINALIYEKNKKKDFVKRLSKDMARIKNVRKENALKDQIKLLNSQIEYLENEIKQSDGSLSSISSIPPPIKKKSTTKEKKKENVLPNYSSRSSSSSVSVASFNKSNDKPVSAEVSKEHNDANDISSSATLISDREAVKMPEDQKSKGKIEEIDTPRSVKQLQFGDINEEYSASDRDSSELRTPSEKSRLSKDITDNGATKSKSEKFHFLNLGEDVVDNGPEDVKVVPDEGGMMSARTIHSEMSDLVDECVDLSDQEIEEIENCNFDLDGDSEREQPSSYKDLYSDKFEDSSSHRTGAKIVSKVTDEPCEVSEQVGEKQLEYETSPDSSESLHPIIPPRKKEKLSSAVTEELPIQSEQERSKELLDHQVALVDSISEKVFQDFVEDLVKYVDSNRKKPENVESGSDESIDAVSFNLDEALSPNMYTTLVPWKDDIILPLVDVAVQQLFAARMNRTGSTMMAFNQCLEHLPEQFTSKNDEETIKDIIRICRVIKTSDKKYYPTHVETRHIDKMFIYEIVLEIVRRIYSMDDEPLPSVWLKDVFNVRRNKMIRLWKGSSEPTTVELVSAIVREEMCASGVLASESRPHMKRARLHDWFIRQHRDRVDQLLVDETIQDEGAWNMYEKLEEDIMLHWSDDILVQLIDDSVAGVLELVC